MIIRKIEPRLRENNGKSVWCVTVPKDLRKSGILNHRFFGENKAAADEYAQQLTDSRKSVGGGGDFMKLNTAEQVALLAALQELGPDDLMKAVAHWRATKPNATPISVQAAVDQCIAAKDLARCRPHYIATLRCSLDNFARSNQKNLHEVTSKDVSDWMHNNGWQPKTQRNYQKDVDTLYKWAIKLELVTRNPAAGVDRPRLDQKPIKIFSLEDCKKFLNAVKHTDPSFIGYIAPILFGGLRPEESESLTFANLRGGGFDLGGEQTKKRLRRVVKIEGVLAQWLALPLAAPEQGPAVEYGWRNGAKRTRRLAAVAGVTWSHDVLRHTFCSYATEKYGARVTAAMAGHTEQILFTNYRQIVTPDAANAFFNLTPDSVSGKLNPAPKQKKWKKKVCNSTPPPASTSAPTPSTAPSTSSPPEARRSKSNTSNSTTATLKTPTRRNTGSSKKR